GRLDAPLVEQVLAVVEAHRPAGLRDRVDLAGEDAGLPLPVDELARVALGVLGDVLERAVDEEGGQRVVADLGHVGGVAGLHGREHLGVAAVGAGGDGLQVDLDVRVGGVERVHGLLDVGHPGPERQFDGLGRVAAAVGGGLTGAAGRGEGDGGEGGRCPGELRAHADSFHGPPELGVPIGWRQYSYFIN